MIPILDEDRATLILGDSLEVLKALEDESVDAVVTDPPYLLGFMSKAWDAADGIAGRAEFWREVLRVLKPGGHLLAFGAPRTYHRVACAIEDAGFEVRDSLHWVYATGFPKSLDVSKALDSAAGAEREVTGPNRWGEQNGTVNVNTYGTASRAPSTAPATDLAKKWTGWGTALKPAHEPIVLARKPFKGTVAENVTRYGTGALNVDACRIGSETTIRVNNAGTNGFGWGVGKKAHINGSNSGRWPANVLFDEEAALELDEQSGIPTSQKLTGIQKARGPKSKGSEPVRVRTEEGYEDSGGASRFFYVAKPARKERDFGCEDLPVKTRGEMTDREDGSAGSLSPRAGAGSTLGARNFHPTVKPIALMRYLIRLVTPPGGIVLDPFLGSGTTGIAAVLEGARFVGIERAEEYAPLARARVSKALEGWKP